jgi:low temperature requirement protein LtrA
VLVVQYFRATSVTAARRLTTWYLVGHGIAAALWLVSSLVPVPVRYVIWTIAFVLDLGTPWGAVRHSVSIPPDPDHLPERFGLFTLILLGESIVAVMHGIEHQEYWSVPAASAALTGMAIAFAVWWWYFDVAHATTAQPVQTHGDAVRLHVWSYAHLPLYLGLVVAFVGIQLIVSVAPIVTLSRVQFTIVAGALAGIGLSLAGIAVLSGRHRGSVSVTAATVRHRIEQHTTS